MLMWLEDMTANHNKRNSSFKNCKNPLERKCKYSSWNVYFNKSIHTLACHFYHIHTTLTFFSSSHFIILYFNLFYSFQFSLSLCLLTNCIAQSTKDKMVNLLRKGFHFFFISCSGKFSSFALICYQKSNKSTFCAFFCGGILFAKIKWMDFYVCGCAEKEEFFTIKNK